MLGSGAWRRGEPSSKLSNVGRHGWLIKKIVFETV